MEAIVLAGGFGTRLKSVVAEVPKPMAPIGGRPFLEILLAVLARQGFQRAILSLGYMADVITAHFGDVFLGMELAYAIEGPPLGTGGGIRLAMGKMQGDHAFVFNGDTFLDLDVAAVEAAWQLRQRPLMVGCWVEDTARYGRLLADGQTVQGFTEKGVTGPGLINAGSYIFGRGQLDAFPVGKPFSLETDYLAPAVATRALDLFVCRGAFIDIGVPEDYARAQTELSFLA